MSSILDYYKEKIKTLRIDRSKGPAPHKPILLLSVIELIEYGKISENKILPTPLITSTFLKYWSKLNPSTHTPNVALPFFHLKSEGFWHLYPNKEHENTFKYINSAKTFSKLRDLINHASLDADLFSLLSNKTYREEIKRCIIETYFQDKKKVLSYIFKENKTLDNQQKELVKGSQEKFKLIKEKRVLYAPRDKAFRNTIMSLYNYTCSICKIQVITLDGESIVDAAHIVPF